MPFNQCLEKLCLLLFKKGNLIFKLFDASCLFAKRDEIHNKKFGTSQKSMEAEAMSTQLRNTHVWIIENVFLRLRIIRLDAFKPIQKCLVQKLFCDGCKVGWPLPCPLSGKLRHSRICCCCCHSHIFRRAILDFGSTSSAVFSSFRAVFRSSLGFNDTSLGYRDNNPYSILKPLEGFYR